jgi:hypothetical protein
MTDTRSFFKAVVDGSNAFVAAVETLELLADRISADTALSTNTAATATASGRADLSAANFDNFKLAVQQIKALMDNTNAGVPNGGTLKLSFYQLI